MCRSCELKLVICQLEFHFGKEDIVTNLQGGRKPHCRLFALKVLPQMCDDVTGEESADSLTLRDEAEVRSPISL